MGIAVPHKDLASSLNSPSTKATQIVRVHGSVGVTGNRSPFLTEKEAFMGQRTLSQVCTENSYCRFQSVDFISGAKKPSETKFVMEPEEVVVDNFHLEKSHKQH